MPKLPAAPQLTKVSKPGLYRAGNGLYLQVHRNGAKSWLLRYQLDGQRRSMGLGPLRLVGLAKARERALRAQGGLLDGVDPINARRAERAPVAPNAAPSFGDCAEAYIAAKAAGWSNAKHAYQWSQSLKTYAYPTIGHLPVNEVTANLVADLLREIWESKSETASRVRSRIEAVLDWARVEGHRSGPNPAKWKGELEHRLPRLGDVQTIEHHEAPQYKNMPALYAALVRKGTITAKALAFTILTASRSGEVRGARWSEIDRTNKTWTIPAPRMKTREVHVVALSDAAFALLPTKDGRPGDLMFPGTRANSPLSDMTLLKAIRTISGNSALTVHGCRATFSTWAAEATDYPREVVEAALAHKVANAVEAAYKRTTFLEKRAALMTDWAVFCRGLSAK